MWPRSLLLLLLSHAKFSIAPLFEDTIFCLVDITVKRVEEGFSLNSSVYLAFPVTNFYLCSFVVLNLVLKCAKSMKQIFHFLIFTCKVSSHMQIKDHTFDLHMKELLNTIKKKKHLLCCIYSVTLADYLQVSFFTQAATF